MLFIQEIRTDWTKQSRGDAEATTRNAVPERLGLPRVAHPLADPLAILHQRVNFDEANDFQRTEKIEQRLLVKKKRERFNGVWVTLEEDTCLLQFFWSSLVGAPNRTHLPRKIGVLEVGEWARVKTNGRFGWDDEWRYQKTVFTIALVTTLAEVEAVFTKEPRYTYDAMAMLR